MRKKVLVGWVEKDWEKRWKATYPFKLWQQNEKEDEDIKVRITIEELPNVKPVAVEDKGTGYL
jgi:hypothetical protein